ncbi:cyclase family protein [Marinomonas agarivorans]|nr:cyclase family protein [Marinomonas agarivorans]
MEMGINAFSEHHHASFHSRYYPLWEVYRWVFKGAKYIDLTHAFEPNQPVWRGFDNAIFKPATAAKDIPGYINKGEEYTYEDHGFVATAYDIPTDQYGTQLDPPSHWNPFGATMSDLPATYAIRPLVVIDVHEKVEQNNGYFLTRQDVDDWEAKYGRIPKGSVVMIRTDWYKKWPNEDFNGPVFPSVGLDALQYLHLDRDILFHGHEPLDTDTTPTLEGEAWLMHNNFAQAEGVANLDKVPEAGALIVIGFAKPQGGTGGYARYVAIAPYYSTPYGETVYSEPGAPLMTQPHPLKRDEFGVMRPTPE